MEDELIEIKEIIKKTFNKNDYKNKIELFLIRNKWNKIIGEKLFENTEPINIINQVLNIKCNHQGWISTLQFYKQDIIKNIKLEVSNELIIKDIIFTVGKIKIKSIKEGMIENQEKNYFDNIYSKESFIKLLEKYKNLAGSKSTKT